MKTRILSLIVTMVLSFTASSIKAQETLYNYCGSLLGRWHMQTERGVYVEDWEAIDDNHFIGNSYKMYLGDTTELEEVRLSISGNILTYEVLVYKQNGGKSVTYTGKVNHNYNEPTPTGKRAYSSMEVRFVKIDHDYPKFIDYFFNESEMRVIIGNREDRQGAQDFTFTKIH